MGKPREVDVIELDTLSVCISASTVDRLREFVGDGNLAEAVDLAIVEYLDGIEVDAEELVELLLEGDRSEL